MIKFQNTYKELPAKFYSSSKAMELKSPELIIFNSQLSKYLNLDSLEKMEANKLSLLFSGQIELENAAMISSVYAGHQFGNFNPRLGDGRALLLGEVVNSQKKIFEIQLKGSGPTEYSRGGDGKSALGPVLREYIVSEAMHELGVPTTRSLAAVLTNEMVYRENPEPGAILTRVASSHIRVGTFEYFAGTEDHESLQILLNYSIDRHYPHIVKNTHSTSIEFVLAVARNQAKLIAKWMSLGFIHGVMNTDNFSISGETIDYGPCAFIDIFENDKVFSFIDRQKRYAYNNQTNIAIWNLYRLASTLIALDPSSEELAIEKFQKALSELTNIFEFEYLAHMRTKFGLQAQHKDDINLIKNWLDLIQRAKMDFTNSFIYLSSEHEMLTTHPEYAREFQEFIEKWNSRRDEDTLSLEQSHTLMRQTNPQFIPRNHLIQEAIEHAYKGDFSHFHKLCQVLRTPFDVAKIPQSLRVPPMEHQIVENTFCGT